MVVGALTGCAWLPSECDLKAAQMNVKRCLIRKFVLYEFERDHNATETTKKHLLCQR